MVLDRINALLFFAVPFFAIEVLAGKPDYASIPLIAGLVIAFLLTRIVCTYVTLSVLKHDIGVQVSIAKQAATRAVAVFIVGTVGGVVYHIASPSNLLAMTLGATIVIVGSSRILGYSLELNESELFLSVGDGA